MFFPANLLVSGRRVLLRHISPLICLTVVALKSVDLAAALPPPVQPVPEAALLALAQKKFGTLSRAEEELFRAAQEGRAASVLANDEKEDDPANAAHWPADRAVRAACLAWVCTAPQASSLVTFRGLEFFGMRIDGRLELDNAEIKFPLLAWKCAFSEDMSLRDATLVGFYLFDCQIKSLNANRAIVKGSVLLRGLKAAGEVNLGGIRISSSLECDGAQFSNAKGLALHASGARIEGSVLLHKGFKADGAVNLVGIRIGGNLQCDGAQFSNATGLALGVEGGRIEGTVFLRNGFEAKGQVKLLGATIGGDLECERAHFSNEDGLALTANGAKIEGDVDLNEGFKAVGQVSLEGVTIGGDLVCGGAEFSNVKGFALLADRAKIDGDVFLRDGFEAQGEVNLSGTRIGRDLDCQGGHFSKPGGRALAVESSKIEGNVFLRKGFRARGNVSLVRATMGSLVIWNVLEADQTILHLELAKAETFWDEEASWPKSENLYLDGFRYDRLYEDAPFQAASRKKWLGLQSRDKFRPQPYEQLASVLRQMGHESEAREVMIEKNRERARFTHFPQQSWWWYKVFGRFIGYGYAPWRAFAASVVMIVLGTFLFRRGFRHGLIAPTSDNAYGKDSNGQPILEENGQPKTLETYPVFNAFVYSLESFTPLLKLDQSANWTPNANRFTEISSLHWKVPTGELLRYYLYFHIAAGWLLTSLWVGAITGLVKT
jgi:sRNA-binding regulator protein Hfq